MLPDCFIGHCFTNTNVHNRFSPKKRRHANLIKNNYQYCCLKIAQTTVQNIAEPPLLRFDVAPVFWT
jgi:hypothetical protein